MHQPGIEPGLSVWKTKSTKNPRFWNDGFFMWYQSLDNLSEYVKKTGWFILLEEKWIGNKIKDDFVFIQEKNNWKEHW